MELTQKEGAFLKELLKLAMQSRDQLGMDKEEYKSLVSLYLKVKTDQDSI